MSNQPNHLFRSALLLGLLAAISKVSCLNGATAAFLQASTASSSTSLAFRAARQPQTEQSMQPYQAQSSQALRERAHEQQEQTAASSRYTVQEPTEQEEQTQQQTTTASATDSLLTAQAVLITQQAKELETLRARLHETEAAQRANEEKNITEARKAIDDFYVNASNQFEAEKAEKEATAKAKEAAATKPQSVLLTNNTRKPVSATPQYSPLCAAGAARPSKAARS